MTATEPANDAYTTEVSEAIGSALEALGEYRRATVAMAADVAEHGDLPELPLAPSSGPVLMVRDDLVAATEALEAMLAARTRKRAAKAKAEAQAAREEAKRTADAAAAEQAATEAAEAATAAAEVEDDLWDAPYRPGIAKKSTTRRRRRGDRKETTDESVAEPEMNEPETEPTKPKLTLVTDEPDPGVDEGVDEDVDDLPVADDDPDDDDYVSDPFTANHPGEHITVSASSLADDGEDFDDTPAASSDPDPTDEDVDDIAVADEPDTEPDDVDERPEFDDRLHDPDPYDPSGDRDGDEYDGDLNSDSDLADILWKLDARPLSASAKPTRTVKKRTAAETPDDEDDDLDLDEDGTIIVHAFDSMELSKGKNRTLIAKCGWTTTVLKTETSDQISSYYSSTTCDECRDRCENSLAYSDKPAS